MGLSSLWHPERYHGWRKSRSYFEGWYYKVVSADEKFAMAFIPGIAMDAEGNQQAFIQVLDGRARTAAYHKFPAEAFQMSRDDFNLRIGGNHFTSDSLEIDVAGTRASLTFSDMVPWPSSWYSPGIMGPFSFVPMMQCYHGILSMDHRVSGTIEHHGHKIDMDGGRGYMEKDWGRSFPEAYIWMQSNHFSESGISLKASVAKIPWMGTSFVGFIGGLWLGDRLIQFTTYNFSRLVHCKVDQGEVQLELRSPRFILEIQALRAASTELASPIMGFMDGRIEESMEAELRVLLRERRGGGVVLDGVGRSGGLEVAGVVRELDTL